VRFSAGWLSGLIACAEETGAWLVSPTVFQEGPNGISIHMIGGDAGVEADDQGRRRYRENHRLLGHSVDELPTLTRQEIGYVEFHCVLVPRPALDTCFPLDEELWSSRDHCDLALQVQQRGGPLVLEPSVTVTEMVMPDRLPRVDRAFYALRWSDAWNR